MLGPPDKHLSSQSSTVPLIEELADTELFRGIPKPILESIQAQADVLVLESGQLLLSPEHENHHVYVLLSGTLGVHFGSLNLPEIRVLEKGASVGELSVIDQIRPSAFIIAREVCRVLPVHRSLFQEILGGADPLIRNLIKVLTKWIRENTECLVHNTSKIGELTNHASTDALTGLYNRRWLDNALAHFLAEAIEMGHPLCVLLIDVDYFKNYNDTLGHSAGDQALKVLSGTLKSAIRPQDFASRYGGEEFLILLPNTSLNEGVLVAERIRQVVETKTITAADGTDLPGVTVSIGLAVSHRDSTPKLLVDTADSKLYQAKQEGRNCVRYDLNG